MNELSPVERRALKARAHALDPVVLVGDKGLTGSVLAEIERAISAHELVKIRVQAEREDRAVMLSEICARSHAFAVQHIGKMLVVYRQKPPEAPQPKLRKPPVGKAPGLKTPARGMDDKPPRARPDRATFGRAKRPTTMRPTTAKARTARAPARGTARPEFRTASPRRAPAHPPGRRRTSR